MISVFVDPDGRVGRGVRIPRPGILVVGLLLWSVTPGLAGSGLPATALGDPGLVLLEGQAYLTRGSGKARTVTGEVVLEIGDWVTTSPKARGHFTLPEQGIAAVEGLGRYRVGVDGVDRILPGSRVDPLHFAPLSGTPVAEVAPPEVGTEAARVGAPGHKDHRRHRRAGPVPTGARIEVIEGRVHLNRKEWPAPFPVHGGAQLEGAGQIDIARDALVQVTFTTGGWIRSLGPARIILDGSTITLDQGEMLIKDLAGRRIKIGPYTVDPGDYLVAFKIGKTIRIKSLEGLIPVRGDGNRQLFLAPGREVIFDTIHASGKTQSTDIRSTLTAWTNLFTEALNRRQLDRNRIDQDHAQWEEEDARRREEEEETLLRPEVEPRRHHRSSLRERVHAVGNFEGQWCLNRKREYQRASRHVAFLNEARRRDPDSSVKAFELYKARSRQRFAHQTLTELKRSHQLAGDFNEFQADQIRLAQRAVERERLFAQPFKMQTRRAIVAAGQIDGTTRQAVDGLTNQIEAIRAGTLSPEDIPTLEARRTSFLDSLQRVLDQTDAALRTEMIADPFAPGVCAFEVDDEDPDR